MGSLELRKRADKTTGRREVRHIDGQRRLVNPDTPGDDHEPWPVAGVDILGEPPAEHEFSTKFVAQGIAEGWIEGEDEEVVHRPGGPVNNQWAVTHTFVQYSSITLHLTDRDLVYKVTHQPDKYAADGTDKTKVTADMYADGATRIDSFYRVKLQKGA